MRKGKHLKNNYIPPSNCKNSTMSSYPLWYGGILKKINSNGGDLVLLKGILGTRYNIAEYNQGVKKDIEISGIKNNHCLDIIDIKEKYNGEINILKDSITLLRFRYERKKTEIVR